MLPYEIEPFADHHICALRSVRDDVKSIIKTYQGSSTDISVEDLESDVRQLDDAISAFVRYKVCMADEVKQKHRMSKIVLEHRLHCNK
jgi:acetolactate synthase small subunit